MNATRPRSRRFPTPMLLACLGLAILVFGLQFSGRAETTQNKASASPDKSTLQRGEYLVRTSGCHDCHTPFKNGSNGPEPDMTRMLSGHPEQLKMPPPPKLPEGPWNWVGAATNTAFAGPFGISYSINLTPDENTGIGIWTEDIFIKTLRTGKHWGTSRPILPPMPWPGYAQMTDADLRAIFAYLRSIPPIVNRVPESQPAPPPAK